MPEAAIREGTGGDSLVTRGWQRALSPMCGKKNAAVAAFAAAVVVTGIVIVGIRMNYSRSSRRKAAKQDEAIEKSESKEECALGEVENHAASKARSLPMESAKPAAPAAAMAEKNNVIAIHATASGKRVHRSPGRTQARARRTRSRDVARVRVGAVHRATIDASRACVRSGLHSSIQAVVPSRNKGSAGAAIAQGAKAATIERPITGTLGLADRQRTFVVRIQAAVRGRLSFTQAKNVRAAKAKEDNLKNKITEVAALFVQNTTAEATDNVVALAAKAAANIKTTATTNATSFVHDVTAAAMNGAVLALTRTAANTNKHKDSRPVASRASPRLSVNHNFDTGNPTGHSTSDRCGKTGEGSPSSCCENVGECETIVGLKTRSQLPDTAHALKKRESRVKKEGRNGGVYQLGGCNIVSRDSKSGVSDVPSTGGLPPSGCPEPKSKRATKAITKTVEIQTDASHLRGLQAAALARRATKLEEVKAVVARHEAYKQETRRQALQEEDELRSLFARDEERPRKEHEVDAQREQKNLNKKMYRKGKKKRKP